MLAGVDAALAQVSRGSTATGWASRAAATAGSSPTGSSRRRPRFKAAVPAAGISNLVTQNYLSYYHDYLAVEFGGFPHERPTHER